MVEGHLIQLPAQSTAKLTCKLGLLKLQLEELKVHSVLTYLCLHFKKARTWYIHVPWYFSAKAGKYLVDVNQIVRTDQ